MSAAELSRQERKAYLAFDQQVLSLIGNRQGISPHQAANSKTIVTECLAMLARGWEAEFIKAKTEFAAKAVREPLRYSPISHALQTIEIRRAHHA